MSTQRNMASSVLLTTCCIFAMAAIVSAFAASNIGNLDTITNLHDTRCWNTTKTLPYQISLQLATTESTNTTVFKHFCGGALIKPDVVVTAAQCVVDTYSKYLINGSMYAVAGIQSLDSEPEGMSKSLVKSSYRLRHYYGANGANIAVLQLQQSVLTKGGNISVVPLRISHEVPYESCFTSGWGTPNGYTVQPSQRSSHLQVASASIMPHQDCVQKYSEINGNHIFEENLCAGVEVDGTEACQSDAGGPLVCYGELTGVVSKGYERSMPSFPAVYTSVHYHHQFIQRAIQIMQYDNLTAEDGIYVSLSKVRSYSNSVARPASLLIIASVAFTNFLCKL